MKRAKVVIEEELPRPEVVPPPSRKKEVPPAPPEKIKRKKFLAPSEEFENIDPKDANKDDPPPPRLGPAKGQGHTEWRRGVLRAGTVETFSVKLRYRFQTATDPYKVEVRWYMIGCVFVAFCIVYKRQVMASGVYNLSIVSHQGNGGVWFNDEDEMHKFIVGELSRKPLDN